MIKKIINFPEMLIEEIEAFQKEKGIKKFADAIRILIQNGLNIIPDEWIGKENINSNDEIKKLKEEIEQLKKENTWFKADETQSKISQLEFNTNELDKKVNIILGASKLFKKHINDREIHLVDR